jgi:predicted PurR-regulated permease PerM
MRPTVSDASGHYIKDTFMAHSTPGAEWQRAIVLLSGTVISVVAVAILYFAQSMFIPVALAVFLTFLLSPLVSRLRAMGLSRTPAVIMTVCAAAVVLGLSGWIVTAQISSLLRELPEHTATVKAKVKSLKQFAGGSGRIAQMIEDINSELKGAPESSAAGDAPSAAREQPTKEGPRAVVLQPQSPLWLERITGFLSPLLEYVGELALAIILVIFMLQKREEFRNRVIRLVGHGRIAASTKFVDEAGHRISRFLLMQAIVNGSFGLVLGFGLLAIGVKYALLWGFLGAMLRYLPYIGPYLASVFPIATTLALSEGWSTTLLVIGLFVVLELIVANGVEPWLYGQSMGVSEIALLVSAAFWAFMWGPIGLVLSSPLTVCMVMLGRYVPRLEFLAVLLGDEPALAPTVSFYQRLLARDQDEAEDLILEHLKTDARDQVFDTMLVPALRESREGKSRGEITEADENAILQSISEIAEDLGDILCGSSQAGAEGNSAEQAADSPSQRRFVVFGCPARDNADLAALGMLEKLIDPARWRMKLIAPQTLGSELLEMVALEEPDVVCIAAIPPGGRAHTRYLCKRLHARFPDLRIIVGRWGESGSEQKSGAELEQAGVFTTAVTLLETRQQLHALLPLLEPGHPDWPGQESPDARTAVKPGPSNSRGSLHRAALKEVAAKSALP